jgi:geranylgeranyl pyrophosphate synthase
VVEFIHTASLLHDDVVDESDLRRGKRTANAAFGNASAVLVGDFLYSRAFQMMVGVDDMRVMRVLADATNVIAEGEVLQLLNCHNADVVIDDYLRVIRYKTAKLFEAAARLGGIVAARTTRSSSAWPPSACIWAPPSSSSTTCSTIPPTRPTPASTWATTSPKASRPCR